MRKNIFVKTIILTSIATTLVVAMSLRIIPARSKLIIHFENYVGNKRLVLDTISYKNAFGQPFVIANFKYYVSNISLKGNDGKDYFAKDSFFLIKQDDETTWTAALDDVPAGKYKSISFTIGVDSLHNCSGAQSGALDPVNGMFWTWNSGYIFLKLEGRSPDSKSPGGLFEYHIGGYKAPNNSIRKATINMSADGLTILGGKTTSVFIKADAAEVLKNPNNIDFSKLSSVTDFHNAAMIADNYTDIFSLIRVSNEW